MRNRLLITVILLLLLIITACNAPLTNEDDEKANHNSQEGSVEVDPARIAILKRSCLSCHGVDLAGVPGDGPSLQNAGDRFTKAELRDILKNGKNNGRMPKGLLEGGVAQEGDLEMMVEWLSQQKTRN